MVDVVALMAPIFLTIGIGAGFLRLGLFPPEGLEVLNRFLMRVCIPPLLFAAVTGGAGGLADFAYLNAAIYAGASLASGAVVVALMRGAFGRDWPQAFVLGLGGACANSIFLGFPIAAVVIPERAAQVFAWVILAEISLVIPILTTLALMAENRGGQGAGGILLPLLRSPVTIGLAAGFAFLASGLTLPGAVARVLDDIVGAAPFIALFVIGGMLARADLSRIGPQAGAIAAVKLLLHPALVGLAFALAFGWEDTVTRDALLFAAIPLFSTSVVFCARHGVGDVAASAVVLTTLIGGASVTALLALIG